MPGSKCIHAADGGQEAEVNPGGKMGYVKEVFAVKRRNREVRVGDEVWQVPH